MTADLSPHSSGGQGFEPESLICCYLILTLQIPFLSLLCLSFWICSLCHCCLGSEKRFRHSLMEAVCAVCSALVVLIEKVEVVGEFRNITREHGLVAFVHETRQWLKASHPSPRRQVLLSPPPRLLLRSAKHLAFSWELSSAIRPFASSALLCTDLMGPDHKIIVLT